MLRRHGIASVVSEGAGRWPMMEEVTADFVYVRLHYTTRYWGAERRSVIIEELHQFLSGSRTLPDQSCDSESRAARSASSG